MAAFLDAEYKQRLANAQQMMSANDLSCIVCVSPELLFYFSGYDGHTHFSDQALVLGAGDAQPTLVHRDVDSGLADDSCWHDDRRTYHHGESSAYDVIRSAVAERSSAHERVGIEFNTHALKGAKAFELRECLAEYSPVDASVQLQSLRLIKSEAERACLRNAGAFANAGLARAREVAKPGMSEIELAGHLELAMRQVGSEYPAMPAWVSSGSQTTGAHKTPSLRRLVAGDRIKLEFAGVSQRYHAVTMQTFWLRESPAQRIADTYAVALEALRCGEQAIHDGVPVAHAEQAAFAVLEQQGFDLRWHSRFGYGVGIAYPPTWLECLDITQVSEQVFNTNQSFTLHIAVKDPVQGYGLMLGGAYLLSDGGLQTLSGGALEMAVV